MSDIGLAVQFCALVLLLVVSALFSMSETVMMAANRYRLRSLAAQNHRGARLAVDLLNQTDRLLGVILLFNNLVNTAAAMLVSIITLELFGDDRWALGAATLAITFIILVFSEITPKVIGAHHADRLALIVSYPLSALLRVFYSVIWFVNLFSRGLLILLRLQPRHDNGATALSTEELRSMVLESGQYIPQTHRSILVNLFDLENITVEDVMTPRGAIEGIDLSHPIEELRERIATSYHTRLPVHDGDSEQVIGVLHLRRLLSDAFDNDVSTDKIRRLMVKPYFVPADTPLYSQIQFFQENRQRLALVVDEYGAIVGIATIEDVVEEIVGEIREEHEPVTGVLTRLADGSYVTDGDAPIREVSAALGLTPPDTGGFQTIAGLILHALGRIPTAGTAVSLGGFRWTALEMEGPRITRVRIERERGSAAPAAPPAPPPPAAS